jgi:hypothetical protein
VAAGIISKVSQPILLVRLSPHDHNLV